MSAGGALAEPGLEDRRPAGRRSAGATRATISRTPTGAVGGRGRSARAVQPVTTVDRRAPAGGRLDPQGMDHPAIAEPRSVDELIGDDPPATARAGALLVGQVAADPGLPLAQERLDVGRSIAGAGAACRDRDHRPREPGR